MISCSKLGICCGRPAVLRKHAVTLSCGLAGHGLRLRCPPDCLHASEPVQDLATDVPSAVAAGDML